jgi:hypothetical protein
MGDGAGGGRGALSGLAALVGVVGVLLVGCAAGVAAQGGERTRFPLVVRDPAPTATATPAPTPVGRVTNPPGLRLASFAHRADAFWPQPIYRIENDGGTTYYGAYVEVRYYDAAGQLSGGSSIAQGVEMLRPGEFTTSGISASIYRTSGWSRYEVVAVHAYTQDAHGRRFVHDGLEVVGVGSTRRSGSEDIADFTCEVKNNTGRDVAYLRAAVSIYRPDGQILGADLRTRNEVFPAGATFRLPGHIQAAGHVPDDHGRACVAEAREL